MIDPTLKYCPNCGDEYLATIRQCAACDCELVSGREILAQKQRQEERKASRGGALKPDDDIVTVYAGQMQEIKTLEALLERENIGCLVTTDPDTCGKGCCPATLYLHVRREDGKDALEIVEGEIGRTTGLDHHDTSLVENVYNPAAAEVQCPACGATFTPTDGQCPDCGLCF